MPELPEVETIRRGLEKHLVGLQIVAIDVRLSRIFFGDPALVIGAKIVAIERFGKGMVISLDNDYVITIHIKMTGQLIYEGSKGPNETPHFTSATRGRKEPKVFHQSPKVGGSLPNKWTHIIFHLQNVKDKTKSTLFYNDIRQFGWIKVVKKNEVRELPFFKNLGPEPLKDLTLEKFADIIRITKGPIKPLLMDQKKIGGIGNIYANDALWKAKIHPKRKANSLSDAEITELFAAIEFVLKKSLSYGGASEVNFVNAFGEEGGYQHHFLVYGRQGKPCKKCGTKIEKSFLAGRGTFFCPNCQIEINS